MSDESIDMLKYAITIGYQTLLEAYDTFESLDKGERSKYWKMIEELAEELNLTIYELTDHL